MSTWRKWSYYAWSVLEMARLPQLGVAAAGVLRQEAQSRGNASLLAPTHTTARARSHGYLVGKETFLDQFYTRYGTSIEQDWVIVDIGAAIGEFTVYAAQEPPAGEVYAYEPNPQSFALLQENILLNKLSNVQAFCVGVWDQTGTMQLDLVNAEPLQGKTVFQQSDTALTAEIPVITFDQLVQDSVNSIIDLLKLDCEGAEYAILLPASPESLARVQRIVMEYHDIDAEHEHSRLVRFLEGSGFSVQLHTNPVHAEIGYLYAWKE